MQATAPTRRIKSPRWGDPPIRWLLRSPFHGLVDKQLMLVTIKGRVSRRMFTIPVGYFQASDMIYVLVSDPYSKRWWRNLDGGAQVELTLRGKVVDADATVLHTGFDSILEAYCEHLRGIARMLKVAVVDGVVDQNALQQLASQVVMVRFQVT